MELNICFVIMSLWFLSLSAKCGPLESTMLLNFSLEIDPGLPKPESYWVLHFERVKETVLNESGNNC